MSFPSTLNILDDFSRADGAIGANYVAALGGSNLTVSGGRAVGVGSSAWAVPLASGVAVYARVPVLPTTGTVRISLCSNLAGTLVFSAAINPDLTLTCTSPGATSGVAGPLGSFAAGDWIAVAHQADGLFLHGWYLAASAGVWQNPETLSSGIGRPRALSGYFAVLEITDSVARVDRFGAETLPSANVTAPIMHGRGAC